uniref:Uncharacterized protein n=1 Tax=Ananas comosus var. bracteatus TaxID=296719 RepID=A0A6V7Q463_ANACO|nr:unnamed protein product [Ananas comosus var. bracteatus]
MTSGNPPSGRDSHTCSSWRNKLIVIGGEDSSDCYLSDVYALDTETLAWEKMITAGQAFPPRAGHTAMTIGSNIFVFGGFRDDRNLYDDLCVLDVDRRTWSRLMPVNQGPSARFSMAGDCLDASKGTLVLIGGCNQSLEALDDIYYLHTDMPIINGLLDERRERISIRRELKRKCQEEYLPKERLKKDNSAPQIALGTDSIQIENMQQFSQSGRKARHPKAARKIEFEARIMNINHHGYAIETVIGGKVFHGLLFSCTSIPCQGNDANANEKVATEAGHYKESMQQPTVNDENPVRQQAESSEQPPGNLESLADSYAEVRNAVMNCAKEVQNENPHENAPPSAIEARTSLASEAPEANEKQFASNRLAQEPR